MIRILGKWLISRAIEQNAPLPRWLRRRIDRDAELARFESASRQLAARLRRDAAGWIALQSGESRQAFGAGSRERPSELRPSGTRRRAVWAAAACALAASVAFALAARPWEGEEAAPRAPGGNELTVDSGPATLSPSELIAAWQSGRANVDAWQARLRDIAGSVNAFQIPATILNPHVSRAQATTERVRAAVDATVASQRQMALGVQSAYSFFAHRLPTSVARLVGLRAG